MSYQFRKKYKQCVKTTDQSLFSHLQQSFRIYYLQQDVLIFYRIQPHIQKSIWIYAGDSYINQLLVITQKIFSIFDDSQEIKRVFLYISKAFNKVCHEGISHKLKRNGVSGNLFSLLIDFLRNRKQRVILNSQSSSWASINAGLSQGSILGPPLFLIYINDLILSYSLMLKYPEEKRIN